MTYKNISGKFRCEYCDYTGVTRQNYNKHITTRKHLILQNPPKSSKMTYENISINPDNFRCDGCDYTGKTIQNYNKHILTRKHKLLPNPPKSSQMVFSCVCGKEYKHRQTLSAHKKKCPEFNNNRCDKPKNEIVTVLLEQNTMFQELILKNEEEKNEILRINQEEKKELLRRNEEQQTQMMDLQKQFLEAIKNGSLGNTINNNNNTNTQNNQFNLQFYLNETCKDAINLDEFLESIQLTSQDYVNTGEVGFITGLTDIFRKELHKLEPHNRPLQCTDVKREVIYVKENDKWAKDIENKKTKNIVRRIDLSYQRMMYQWMKENPEHVEEEGPLVEEGIKYSAVCLGNNRLNGNEPIFRNKIFTNILDDIAIKKGNKVITVE